MINYWVTLIFPIFLLILLCLWVYVWMGKLKGICGLFGHKSTWMRLNDQRRGYVLSHGFACSRCGVRLGWDGGQHFSVFPGEDGQPEKISQELLREIQSRPLRKVGHWFVSEEKHATTGVTLTPMEKPKWAK